MSGIKPSIATCALAAACLLASPALGETPPPPQPRSGHPTPGEVAAAAPPAAPARARAHLERVAKALALAARQHPCPKADPGSDSFNNNTIGPVTNRDIVQGDADVTVTGPPDRNRVVRGGNVAVSKGDIRVVVNNLCVDLGPGD